MAEFICHTQYLRFLKFHCFATETIISSSYWYIKPNDSCSQERITNVYVLKISKSWTNFVETKVENPVNSRNNSTFQVVNSSLYPHIPMLNLAKTCYGKPETLQTTLIRGMEGVFLAEAKIFYFLLTSSSKIIGYWYFLKNTPQIAEWVWNACWCTVSFNFNQVQVREITSIG